MFVDYAQSSANQERYAANSIAKYYDISLKIYNVQGMKNELQGMIVGRNALLLLIAMFEEQYRVPLISIGIHNGTSFPDCSETFIKRMQSIYDLYCQGTVLIGTPFINFYKIDIWEYCKLHKIPLNLTYSCELGKKQPCGICPSCKELEKLYVSQKDDN